jgi:hypothetical protein
MFTSGPLGVSEVIVGRIRQTHIGRPGVTYDPDSDDAGGDWCDQLLSPPASFLTTGNLSSLAIDEPAHALNDGDHCREMAGKLRQLARYTKSLGIRRELVGLAKRYDWRGEYFDRHSR